MAKINFTLMPSLEHLSLFKIAIILWKKQSDRFNCKQIYSIELNSLWQHFEIGSEKQVNYLPLPVRAKINVLNVYRIVCKEINLWIKLHSKFLSKEFYWLCDADWTPIGTLDYKSTALKLVRDENVPLMDRYKLACTYCFEDSIQIFYNKLVQGQNYEIERQTIVHDLGFIYLMYVWSLKIDGNCYFSDDEMFASAAFCGNTTAALYFFQKLSIETKDEWLVGIAKIVVNRCSTSVPTEVYPKMVFFLLQQMNVEQVTELIQSNAYDVLKCFLDWPLQYHFMTMIKYAWNYLNESTYNSILSAIALKSSQGYQDWDYEELRRELLQQSPETCKRYFKGGGTFLNK